jgi:hypothetical protein
MKKGGNGTKLTYNHAKMGRAYQSSQRKRKVLPKQISGTIHGRMGLLRSARRGYLADNRILPFFFFSYLLGLAWYGMAWII